MSRKTINRLSLHEAVSEIKHAYDDAVLDGAIPPHFFVVGAGASAPQVPTASEIIEHCRAKATEKNRHSAPAAESTLDQYSFWLEKAYPHSQQRTNYLKRLIEKKKISQANFRLAHLLLGENGKAPLSNLVVTTNFDDHLSRALALFGKRHITCDHPATTTRIALADRNELFLVHVHGAYFFYDCKNLSGEIHHAAEISNQTSSTMASLLDAILRDRSPLVIGYGGWEGDVFMDALKRRLKEPLPYNLYWFCYQYTTPERLPEWLRANANVKFVVPDEPKTASDSSDPPGSGCNDSVGLAKKEKSISSSKSDLTGKLTATAVFDAFVQALELEPPALTNDPFKSFADRMRNTFPTEDLDCDDDIYALKSVINRIERAAQPTEVLESEITVTEALFEDVRNAIRRSQYSEALHAARKIDFPLLEQHFLEEFTELAATIAISQSDDLEAAIDACDMVDRAFHRLAAPTLALQIQVAGVLLLKGGWLGQLNRGEEEIAVYDEVAKRFGEAPEAALRERVATALFNKGFTFGQMGESDHAIEAYDEVVKRYGDAPEVALREPVAKALNNKGVWLGQIGENGQAIAAYDEVVKRCGDAPEVALREQVAIALNNKGARLGRMGKNAPAIASYDELVKRYGAAPEAALREQVAMALNNKGTRLHRMGENAPAIAAYDEVVKRYSEAPEAALQAKVAMALFNKGFTFGRMGESDQAMAAYDEVEKRYGNAPEAALQASVASALANKASVLAQRDRDEEAIMVYEDVIRRFGGAPEVALGEPVATALNGMGFLLLCNAKKVWREGDAVAAAALLAQALERVEAALARMPDEPVSLGNQGYILFLLGRAEEARPILAKAVSLGGDELRQMELQDANIHPLPQDEAFKALIGSL